MGEGNKSEGRFYVTGPNGEITTMGEMEGLPELIGKMPEEPTRIRFGDLEWEIKVPIPKVLRCKSRKRLIKLLMSTGMPRNTATTLAEAMYTYGVKYQDGWLTFIYRRLQANNAARQEGAGA